LQDRGDDEGALRASQEMLATCEEIGDRWGMALALHNSGNALAELGRRTDAMTHWERAATLFREVNDRRRLNIALGNIAQVHLHLGDLVGAERRTEEVLAQVARAEDKSFLAYMTLQAATIQEALGELPAARATTDDAMQLARQLGERPRLAEALVLSARLAATGGQLAPAERQLDEAAEILRAMGQNNQLRGLAVERAEIALGGGRADVAARLASESIAEYEREKTAIDQRLRSLSMLTRALVAQHKASEARPVIDRAAVLMPAEAQVETRLRVELARALVEAAEGRTAAARRRGERVLAEARRAHHALLELRARLLEVSLALQPTPTLGARARAQALADEATRRGYVLLARQAAALTH
jgi:tetratricopeptide (TPR) repeat protein